MKAEGGFHLPSKKARTNVFYKEKKLLSKDKCYLLTTRITLDLQLFFIFSIVQMLDQQS